MTETGTPVWDAVLWKKAQALSSVAEVANAMTVYAIRFRLGNNAKWTEDRLKSFLLAEDNLVQALR